MQYLIHGHVESKFKPLQDVFRALFEHHHEVGAALCVSYKGSVVADLWGGVQSHLGEAWRKDTRVNVFSVAKGLLSACVHHLIYKHEVDLKTPLASFWPEFAHAGKESITLEDVLSHRAGLPFLPDIDDASLYAEVVPFETAVQLLENAPPVKVHHTSSQSYHALTFGWLMGGLIEKISGDTFLNYFDHEWNNPLGINIDFKCLDTGNIAGVLLPKMAVPSLGVSLFKQQIMNISSHVHKAFGRPKPYLNLKNLNNPSVRSVLQPALNCVLSASSLCRFYEVLALSGALHGRRWVHEDQIADISGSAKCGEEDAILKRPVRFVGGFMKNTLKDPEGSFFLNPSDSAFGHVGAGGSVGFADPPREIAFAYVMNQLGSQILLNARGQMLIDALYDMI